MGRTAGWALAILALAGVACQPTTTRPRPVPARNVWITADAGESRPDAREKDAAGDAEAGRRDGSPSDVGTPRDAAASDRPRTDGAIDREAPHDAGAPDAAKPDAAPTCGSSPVSCAPYLCDVDAGRCRSFCNISADCAGGLSCVANTCLGGSIGFTCASNSECVSGFCVDGVCCDTACTGPCHSCGLPGAIGSCRAVPVGTVDPRGLCPNGSFCNANGACVPTSCTADQDCGDAELCTGGTCHPCSATCASTADCVSGAVCVFRNSCTSCAPRDAGTDAR